MSENGQQIAPDRPDIFGISWIAVACILTVVVITLFGMAVYFRAQAHENRLKGEATIYSELQNLEAEQQEELNSVGWVDRDNGIVRIPIDQAMELVVERVAEGERILPQRPDQIADTEESEQQSDTEEELLNEGEGE
jgi:hypothetical protein